MDTMRMKAVFVFVAALAFASAPLWSGGFGGFDPSRYPIPQDDPPIQPAGYAFSIWGLIYLWLVAHGAYGLFARSDDPGWDRTRWPLIVSLAPGAAWISVAQASPLWATVLIWLMLAGALAALFLAPRDRDRWLLIAPLGLYAGWLTAASVVSLGLLGAGYGVGGGGFVWAWIGLLIALGIALTVQSLRPAAPEYGFAVAWALIAVAVANWGGYIGLAGASGVGALVMLITALQGFRGRAA